MILYGLEAITKETMKRQKGAGKVVLDRPRTVRPSHSRCTSVIEGADKSSTPNLTSEICQDTSMLEEKSGCASVSGLHTEDLVPCGTNFMRRIHRSRVAKGKWLKKGRGLALGRDGLVLSADARKSQFQYLKNINIHDRWLRMAVVHQALFVSCGMHEAEIPDRSMELKRFENFDLFTLVFALIYLKKITKSRRLAFDVSMPLFLVCNIIALKYQDDFSTFNCRYLKICSLSLRDLNCLEADVLLRLDYRVDIDYSEIISVIDERISYLNLLNRR